MRKRGRKRLTNNSRGQYARGRAERLEGKREVRFLPWWLKESEMKKTNTTDQVGKTLGLIDKLVLLVGVATTLMCFGLLGLMIGITFDEVFLK